MARDHVISVRLTEAERDRLARRGRVSDVVRDIIAATWAPPLPLGVSKGFIPPEVTWSDGTASNTWPALVTG